MPTYVAFLRAINLGAKRKFPKNALVAATEAAGFTSVQTHINTGNLLVSTPMRSRAKVEAALEKAYVEDRGFEVPTIAFTPAELCQVVADADEFAADLGNIGVHYVSLLKQEPTPDVVAEAERVSYDVSADGEHLRIRGRAVHLALEQRESYHAARLGNAWVEKRLGVATNRNLTVLRAITAKWCS
ncbi:hypothetical protein DDE18_19935 [Nocardioides gansuensis]|uniref:DUF1697 domain-containing protein n=1 Tax=Nocardioides gansuensis TaxID=2138300 RepID=A0A2T8F5V3_9ACTN|nr:DUF1697 domain-containing protein [Nocardioides gansuensis]PVG81084.1 hypothetical protein DDE18_19935 [Nocardioides gansuensis]